MANKQNLAKKEKFPLFGYVNGSHLSLKTTLGDTRLQL